MAVPSTNWSTTSISSTNWSSLETGGAWQLDSVVVTLNSSTALLNGQINNTAIDMNSTNWSSTSINSTNWTTP